MKTKRLYSRVGGTVLALLLVLSMCIAPLSSLTAKAAGYIDSYVSIIALTDESVTIEANGEPVDMSSYFTLYYSDDTLQQVVYLAYDYSNYYAGNSEDVGTFTDDDGEYTNYPISDMFTMTYYDSEGEPIPAPSAPGTYSVTASTSETVYLYVDKDYSKLGYYQAAVSAPLEFTVTGTEKPGTEDPGTEDPGTENPGTEDPGTEDPGTEDPGTEDPGTEQPSDGIVEFKAVNGTEVIFEEGEVIDLTDYFVLYWNDEPLTFMQDRNYTSYYSKDTAPEGTLTMEDAYTVSYYDADGNELAGAPSKAGTYTAKAALTSSDVYYWTGLYNWCRANKVDSEVIKITVGNGEDASNTGAAIKFKGGKQTFAEGDEIDLSSSFSVYYDGEEVYALMEYATSKYYYADYEPVIGELLVYNFYDEEGNKLNYVPEEAGVYAVSASFPEGYIYAYADASTGIDYISPAESEKYKITITAAEASNAPLTEGLEVKFVGGTTEFEVGDTIDFSEAFTIELNGVEPVIIFDGYVGEDGNWIWGTNTDKDYVNYSDTFDGYVPFSDLYVVHYWSADGTELEEAPSEPGNYYVSADVFDISANGGRRCIYIKYAYDDVAQVITEDEHYFYEGGAESEKIPFIITETQKDTTISCEELTEVPDSLAQLYETPEDIEKVLVKEAMDDGYTNSIVYDVQLMISTDGGLTYVPATEADFPENGITVTLPYPEGTGKEGYKFVVSHMFTITSEKLGTTAGDIEYPDIRLTDEGIVVTLKGLSPVSISWMEDESVEDPDEPVVDPDEPVTGSEDKTSGTDTKGTTDTTENVSASAKTGDTTPLALYIVLIVACGIVVAAMVQRRRKNV